jgi:MoaA/NifB/PqqE/SkfB family radical SAM enzyme
MNPKIASILKKQDYLEPEFISGWKLIYTELKIWLYSAKYIFKRKAYPLFSLKTCLKGLWRPRKVLELNKIVKFNNQYFITLLKAPHWPSKAFDRYVAQGGLNMKAAGTELKKQIDFVIIAITSKCPYHCQHCYEHYNITDKEFIPLQRWQTIIKQLQNLGVGTIVFSGGEPMERFDGLLNLLESGNRDLSDFHLHTSGYGVTLEKAKLLKSAGLTAAGIGLDDFREQQHDWFRGYKGAYRNAIQAVDCFREAGIFPYLNVCLTRELISNENLWKYYALAKTLKAGAIQLYEPKICGRYLKQEPEMLFSENDQMQVIDFFKTTNYNRKYQDYPKVIYSDYFENSEHLGCLMGALSHFYVDSRGNVQPCVFVPVSFGNILQEDFLEIYFRMRQAIPRPLTNGCPSRIIGHYLQEQKSKGLIPPIAIQNFKEQWEKIISQEDQSLNNLNRVS